MPIIHTALFNQAFAAVEAIPALEPGEIHLWLWDLIDPIPPRVLTRLARRELLRLLTAYANSDTPPVIEQGEHGKPFVTTAGFPHFNVSHSGNRVAFGFCHEQELGVDIERASLRRNHSALDLARRFFAAEETAALAQLNDASCERAFLQLWTCKEAVLKALGHGLSFGLDRLRFTLGSNGEPQSLLSIAETAGNPADWQIHRFDAGSEHIGSLAWRGPPRAIRTYRLDAQAAPD